MRTDSIRLVNGGIDDETFSIIDGIMCRKLAERGMVQGGIPIRLSWMDPAFACTYEIADSTEGMVVLAGNRSGFLSGVGRILLDGSFTQTGFKPGPFRGMFTNRHELLGTYFATHFGNYYVTAPMDELRRLLEDLALYGQNYLPVWFDMHHYTGADDPNAVAFARRVSAMLTLARRVGMKIDIGGLSNEAFSTTPDPLKAQWHAQNGYKHGLSHYHVEICPHAPGGMEWILQNRRDMLELFRDLHPDFMSFSIYDQGGCTCEKCAPYGAKTYLDLTMQLHELVKEYWPDTKLMLSAWLLGEPVDGEWEYWYDELSKPKYKDIEYIKGLSTAFYQIHPRVLKGEMLGDKKFLGFPEISMYSCRCDPWAGYGANPYPSKLQKDYDEIKASLAGMTSYSEGNYEDANKAMILGLYSGRCASMQDALCEYARFEFGAAQGDEIASILCAMEETLERVVLDGQGKSRQIGVSRADCKPEDIHIQILHPARIVEIAKRVQAVALQLPDWATKNWRWRLIALRAQIDQLLWETNGHFNDAIEANMAELANLYHTCENSFYVIAPLTCASALRHYGDA